MAVNKDRIKFRNAVVAIAEILMDILSGAVDEALTIIESYPEAFDYPIQAVMYDNYEEYHVAGFDDLNELEEHIRNMLDQALDLSGEMYVSNHVVIDGVPHKLDIEIQVEVGVTPGK